MVATYVPPHQPVHVMSIRSAQASLLAATLSFGVLWGAAVASAADEAKKYYSQAMQQVSQGKYEAAAESLRKAIEIRPKFPEAYHLLGIVYANGQRRLPDAADAYYPSGTMAEKASNLAEAEQAYKKAVGARPEFVDAHYSLGFILKSKGELEPATQEFRTTVKLKPDYAEAYMNLGVVYALQHKFSEAEQAYEEAIRLRPTMAEAYYNLGVFYEFHMRDTARALVTYTTYLELGGEDERVQRIVREVKQ